MNRRHRQAIEDRIIELMDGEEAKTFRAAEQLAQDEYYAEMEHRGDLARDER